MPRYPICVLTFAAALGLVASAHASTQPLTPTQVFGSFGEVYLEDDYLAPSPVDGECDRDRHESSIRPLACTNDPRTLPGRLNMPQSAAAAPDGRIVVADTFNHRVQVFTPGGAHLFTIGGLGSLGIPSDQVPLIPGYAGNVNGASTASEPRMFFPSGVDVDANGTIAVADTYNHRILIYTADGAFVRTVGQWGEAGWSDVNASLGRMAYPYQVAVRRGTRLGDPTDTAGRLYVLDQGNQRVQVFDAAFHPLFAFGGRDASSSLPGNFEWPNGLAVDAARGQIFVADGNNHRVQVFSETGAFLFMFGSSDVDNATGAHTGVFDQPGSALPLGGLVVPYSVTVDDEGRIYVSDRIDRVRVYRQVGLGVEFLFDFGGEGAGAGELSDANGIAYGGNGRILVADTYNDRIQVFEQARLRIIEMTAPDRVGEGEEYEVRVRVESITDHTAVPEVAVSLSHPNAGTLESVEPPSGDGGEYDYRFRYRAVRAGSFRISASARAYDNEVMREVMAGPIDVNLRVVGANVADDTPPTSQARLATAPNAAGWVNTNQVVTLTADDVGDGVDAIIVDFVRSDRTPISVAPGTALTFTDGVAEIEYYARDTAGNVETTRHRLEVRVDREAPGIDFLPASPAPTASGWYNTTVTFGYVVTERLSGVESRKLDGQAFSWGTITISGEGAGLRRTMTVVDRAGNSTTVLTPAVNIDRTPPVIACSMSTASIWTPNHKMVPLSVAVTASDARSGTSGFRLTSFGSNEPDNGQGDGDLPNDLQGWTLGAADTTGFVRAERSGKGSGRTYTFTYTATDFAGNVAACHTGTLVAPQSRGR